MNSCVNYRLSICIPTYNRRPYLEKCLSTILDQLPENDVQVVVSDNASTDGTESMMTELIKKNENVVYRRNDQNIGFPNNLLCCMDLAAGEYLWMLGDDDYLNSDAVSIILNVIETYNPDLALADFDYFVEETGVRRANLIGPVGQEAVSCERRDITRKVGVWLSLIGINIVHSRVYEDAKKEPEFLKSDYAGFHITLTGLEPGRKVVFVNQSIMNSRRSTIEGVRWKDWRLFAFGFSSIVDNAVDRKALTWADGRFLKSWMLSGMCQQLLLHLCESRLLPLWEVLMDYRWIKYHGASPWFWFVTTPTCLAPPFIPVYLAKSYRAFKALARRCLQYATS